MEAIPRNDGEQYRFDAFCKAVLRNEARNYHRNKKRLLDREKSLSVLSMEELGQLTSVDHYPSEEFVFSSYGCDLHIDNELVANAFAALPKQEQSILILFCVLELGDGEIGDLMGMSRSAVQRHRYPQRRQSESPRAVKALCLCVHRSPFTPNLPPASAPLAFFAAHSAFLPGAVEQHSGTFP